MLRGGVLFPDVVKRHNSSLELYLRRRPARRHSPDVLLFGSECPVVSDVAFDTRDATLYFCQENFEVDGFGQIIGRPCP